MSDFRAGVSKNPTSSSSLYLYFYFLYVRVYFELRWRWKFEVCTVEHGSPFNYKHITYYGPLKYELLHLHKPLKAKHIRWVMLFDISVFGALVLVTLLPIFILWKIFI